ncbi:MAG: GNAT family N-acetyltransferase, partial [Patescibacteria group bacterium]|nr:GNAT family N-acetyltransferase [Patescibacteria group bacterium]
AFKIQENWSCFISAEELFNNLPELRAIVYEIENFCPGFASQIKNSIESAISLCVFIRNSEKFISLVKENDFFKDAILNNPRFATKLIIKYPEFDEIAKEKIRFLFESKKEILTRSPDLDPQSLTFRQRMQEKLLTFSRNREIIRALERGGINTERWLNYEETHYFILRTGKELVPLSERISFPINRLGQTIEIYTYQIKGVLKNYQKELVQTEVLPREAEEIEINIKEMEKILTQTTSEKKREGIKKGIENLKNKLLKIKKISLWDKILGEINSFTVLKKDLIETQESLTNKEKKYQELLSTKIYQSAELLKIKSELAQIKEDLIKRLSQLERRLAFFRNNFVSLLSPLGQERAESLKQEIEERVSEQFTHFESDTQTLVNLFSEKGEKEKEKLENRPMSIFVWPRNPDIDLYQGNYSPCCIRIESSHMGEESPIADYLTDLGIQIVNIYDETKGEPILAAWCWLGADENGETSLVVDNIEANTLYSSNYPTELWHQLRTYLTRYAQAIGVKKLVLGKANNDLPTPSELAKLPEAGTKYSKIGGYNGRDDYFLEAEGRSVKLIKEKRKRRERAVSKKIELRNLLQRNLNENDFKLIVELERQVYQEIGLVRGQEMINDLKEKNGLKYSVVIYGQRLDEQESKLLGYAIAYEDETDEGEFCVYLDDIAVRPDSRGQGLGWSLVKEVIKRIKEEAKIRNQSIFFDMHLREDSQDLFERHEEDLKNLGVLLKESVLVPDYYDEGEDALYQKYEVMVD